MTPLSRQLASMQALFNAAWEHIIKQGEACAIGGDCVYEGPMGLKCAFAPAIKDYDPHMEDSGAAKLLYDWRDNLHTWVLDCPKDFADDVQSCHDDNSELGDDFIQAFKDNMSDLAKAHNMEIPA